MTMRCSGLSWTTAYVVIGAPPGPVIRKRNGWRLPATHVVVVGTSVRPSELRDRPPTPDPIPDIVVPPCVTVPFALCVCGSLSPAVTPGMPAIPPVGTAAGGVDAVPVEPTLLRRPRPYPANNVTTSTAPKTASLKLVPSSALGVGAGGIFSRVSGSRVSGISQLVPGLVDRRAHVLVRERGGTGHRDVAGAEVDLDLVDAGQRGEFAGHGLDAMRAGHAGDGVGARDGHRIPLGRIRGAAGRVGRLLRCGHAWSGLDESCDRVRRLFHLGGRIALPCGIHHAVREVILEQPDPDRLQRALRRGNLGQHVDTVGVPVDHALQSTDLTLDPAQAAEQGLLVARVPMRAGVFMIAAIGGHGASIPPARISGAILPRGFGLISIVTAVVSLSLVIRRLVVVLAAALTVAATAQPARADRPSTGE